MVGKTPPNGVQRKFHDSRYKAVDLAWRLVGSSEGLLFAVNPRPGTQVQIFRPKALRARSEAGTAGDPAMLPPKITDAGSLQPSTAEQPASYKSSLVSMGSTKTTNEAQDSAREICRTCPG